MDPAPYEDDDDLPEMFCPRCRGPVVEDTQQCPHCGDWITPVDAGLSGPRRWLYVVAVVLMLLATVMWLV